MSQTKKVVIIGAGPAGLTAAYELSLKEGYEIVILEADKQVGGLSKTIDYKGNKIDIGGHRFFSKSDWVLDWWQQFLPIATESGYVDTVYQNQIKRVVLSNRKGHTEDMMMVRPRKSRIYHSNFLFDYPLKLNLRTFKGIGLWKSIQITYSLIYAKIFPIASETTLEHFFINRFGRELYSLFFKDYTEKVWGRTCSEINAEWGRQRVKGLSFRVIIKHYLTTLFYPKGVKFGSKRIEQSLTEYFLYPPRGPGQLWDIVANKCEGNQVDIQLNQKVVGLTIVDDRIEVLKLKNTISAKEYDISADIVISTMPVKNLIRGIGRSAPSEIQKIASKLEYRDFVIVGLLLNDVGIQQNGHYPMDDNWLYIQDDNVTMGRVQLFHNWSPYMTAKENTCWIGVEYFCQKGDKLWNMTDDQLIAYASRELEVIDLIRGGSILDGTVERMPKAYPSYVGSYNEFPKIIRYVDSIKNLYLIGRNGTHKYNNQDHSMLSAKEAVYNILNNRTDRSNIWAVNTEQEYHEVRT